MGSGRMRSKGCKAVAMVRTIRGPGCTCTRCAMDGSCRLGCTRNVTVGAHRAVGGGGAFAWVADPPLPFASVVGGTWSIGRGTLPTAVGHGCGAPPHAG